MQGDTRAARHQDVVLREPEPGDMGWVIQQHGEIYARRGFRLVRSEPYPGFGHDLVGETWELGL